MGHNAVACPCVLAPWGERHNTCMNAQLKPNVDEATTLANLRAMGEEGVLWNDGEQAEGEEETEADSFRCVCGRTVCMVHPDHTRPRSLPRAQPSEALCRAPLVRRVRAGREQRWS